MTYEEVINSINNGGRFLYYSYDHKKALEEYRTSDEFEKQRAYISAPQCYSMPEKLKEKHRVEKHGKIREVHYNPKGKAWKFKIGNKYPKTFYLKDFGVSVFPLN